MITTLTNSLCRLTHTTSKRPAMGPLIQLKKNPHARTVGNTIRTQAFWRRDGDVKQCRIDFDTSDLPRASAKIICNVRDLNPTQMSVVKEALSLSLRKIDKCIQALERNEPQFLERKSKLFPHEVSSQKLIDGYKQVRKGLQRLSHEELFAVDPRNSGMFAFTIRQRDNKPHKNFAVICGQDFFGLDPDMKAHTLIHETCHLVLRVADVKLGFGNPAYTLKNCQRLLQEKPQEAIDNADSWACLTQ